MTEDDDATLAAEAEAADERAERARRKHAARRLNWKLIGSETVEIPIVREFVFGGRSVVVRGRVAVPAPEEITAEAGALLLDPLVDPSTGKFEHSIRRAAEKILTAPDDVTRKHVFERSSFFSALEDAQRGLVREYQELENRRVDERVEASLGLRFYLESFTRQPPELVYFAGPTNSGKTHAAIELLREAASGVYLAPLRLLALEIHERMIEAGIPTSLVTGEERVPIPGARHVASTVEMADLGREIDLAVIDETQLLQDEQRGWAWTLAIAGVRAKKIVMCGSVDGLASAERLARRLGLPIDVRRFERKNPLEVVDAIPLEALKAGDALIAFTRNDVIDYQSKVRQIGRTAAAIYGSLSPAVRRREAERFRSGAAEIVVATDAIGLGLNLPIRRLVFTTLEKFDGVAKRPLTPPEMRQIAGRAGRYGIHERGAVTTLDPKHVRVLRAGLERFDPVSPDLPIWISPTDEHLARLSKIIGTTRVGRLLQFFQTRVRRAEDENLRISDLSDQIEVASTLEMSDRYLSLPLRVRCTYSRAPVSTRGNALAIFARWGERHASEGGVSGLDLMAGPGARDRLLLNEDRSRLATLYLWLAQRFPDVYDDVAEVTALRERIDLEIQQALLHAGGRDRGRPQGGAPVAAGASAGSRPFRPKGPPRFNKKKLPK